MRLSYSVRMAALREAWGGRCVWEGCGLTHVPAAGWRLEFAHLPGKCTGLYGQGRGLPQRYHDVVRNPGSYVLLCRDHHKALDGRGARGTAEYGRIVRAMAAVLCLALATGCGVLVPMCEPEYLGCTTGADGVTRCTPRGAMVCQDGTARDSCKDHGGDYCRVPY